MYKDRDTFHCYLLWVGVLSTYYNARILVILIRRYVCDLSQLMSSLVALVRRMAIKTLKFLCKMLLTSGVQRSPESCLRKVPGLESSRIMCAHVYHEYHTLEEGIF